VLLHFFRVETMPAKKLMKMVNAVEELRDEEVDATAESSDEEMLKIKVRMQCGKSFFMDFWMYDTINYMKQQIMSHLGKGLRDMKVYIGSRELRDEYTLQHQRVKDEVWVVYSTGGGEAPVTPTGASFPSSTGGGAPVTPTGAFPSSSGRGAPSSSSGVAAPPSSSGIRIRGSAGASSSGIRIRGSAGATSSSAAAAGAPTSSATSSIIGDPVIGDILECLGNINARLRRVEEQLQRGP
jgi:hypothetical protein